jgi:hypothetical protein
VLLTGFGPFGDYKVNPSWELVKQFDGNRCGSLRMKVGHVNRTVCPSLPTTKTSPPTQPCWIKLGEREQHAPFWGFFPRRSVRRVCP